MYAKNLKTTWSLVRKAICKILSDFQKNWFYYHFAIKRRPTKWEKIDTFIVREHKTSYMQYLGTYQNETVA